MRITRQMPSFNGVGAGQTATLNMPIGLTYHSLLLSYSGITLAQMTEIRVKGNGRLLFTQSATDLDLSNRFLGLQASAGGLLSIPFDREGLITRQGQELTAIGTGAPLDVNATINNQVNPMFNPTPLTTLQLEIDCAAGSTPVLSAKAIQSEPRPLGAMIKRRRFNYTVTGAGDYEISDLPKGDLIDKIFIKQSAANVTKVVVERDNFVIFERTAAENTFANTDGIRKPQASWFVIDPTENGYGSEAIVTAGVQDLRLRISCSAAVTLTLYVDYLGGLQGQ